MFDIATNVLALIFVLGVLVFVHEFGHFLVAKGFGIGVEVFSLGFGKRLFGWERGGTDYRVSMLPLGGYVKMVGENPDEALTGSDKEYLSKPKWQRLLVLLAGPVMNVVLAFVLTVTVFQLGIRVQADADQPVVVGMVEPDSPADQAGLRPGDRIATVDGEPMPDWEHLRLRIMISARQPVRLGVVRAGRQLEIPIVPEAYGQQQAGRIGIASPLPPEIGVVQEGSAAAAAGLRVGDLIVAVDGDPVSHYTPLLQQLEARAGHEVTLTVIRDGGRTQLQYVPALDDRGHLQVDFGPDPARVVKIRRYPLGEAIVRAGAEMRSQASLLGQILGRLFTGRMSVRTLSGPIEIARFSGGAARTGDPSVLLSFMALISFQLGLLNLLPIPVLDGGQIAVILFESAIRRDLSMRAKERIMQVGLILIVSLMAMVITLDISKMLPETWRSWLPF